METGPHINNLGEIIVAAMSGMLFLALCVVLFFIVYQRRLFQQQQALQRKEQEHQKELLRASLLSQEKERSRIGKDLHDEIGVLLSTSKMYFRHIDCQLEEQKFKELKEKALDMLEQTMVSVRSISHDLHPVVLERLGLPEAIHNMVQPIVDQGDIEISFEHDLQFPIEMENQLNWYRIVQELLHNTMKHARAKHIFIELYHENEVLHLSYTDDGVGIPHDKNISYGLGLKNMESRIKLMNGDIHFFTPHPSGFGIKLSTSSSLSKKDNYE